MVVIRTEARPVLIVTVTTSRVGSAAVSKCDGWDGEDKEYRQQEGNQATTTGDHLPELPLPARLRERDSCGS
jgi:hypothetical protein